MRYKITFILIFLLCLVSCQQSLLSSELLDKLRQVKTSSWDSHSREIYHKLIESLKKSRKEDLKQISYILLTHFEQQNAKELLYHLLNSDADVDVYYHLAETEFEEGNYTKAHELIMSGAATSDSADKIQFYILRTQIFIEQGDLEGANNTLSALDKLSPNNIVVAYYKGHTGLISGNCESSIENFNYVLKIMPELTQINAPLASAYRICGHKEMADKLTQSYSQENFEFQNRFSKTKFELGNPLSHLKNQFKLFNARNDNDSAIHVMKKVISLEPDLSDNYLNLGSMYYRKEDFDNAESQFHKAHDLDKQNIKPLINLGNIQLQLKDYIKAKKYYSMAYQIDPNHSKIIRNLASIEYYLNDYEHYFQLMSELIRREPQDFVIKSSLVKVLLVQKQYTRLSVLLDEWILSADKKDYVFYAKIILNNPEVQITNYQKLADVLLATESSDIQNAGLAFLVKAKFSPQIKSDEIINKFVATIDSEKSSERVNSFIKLVNDLRNNQKLDFKILQ